MVWDQPEDNCHGAETLLGRRPAHGAETSHSTVVTVQQEVILSLSAGVLSCPSMTALRSAGDLSTTDSLFTASVSETAWHQPAAGSERRLPKNRKGPTAHFRGHPFDRVCLLRGIDHRLTKHNPLWTNGQIERMNRTIKEATVQLRQT